MTFELMNRRRDGIIGHAVVEQFMKSDYPNTDMMTRVLRDAKI